MKPIHILFISFLISILSRYVFEYIDPWLGWLSYGISFYLLFSSISKMFKSYYTDKDKDKDNNVNKQ